MGNDILIDTEVKNILKRYYEICNTIDILEDQVKLLEELLQSDDLTCLFDSRSGNGKFDDSSVVEKEVIFKEQIEKVAEIRRQEIRQEISRLKNTIKIKKIVMGKIDKVLNSREFNKDQLFVLQYYYIDKNYNNDKNVDVVNKFNQQKNRNGVKYIYSDKYVENLRDKALKKLSLQLENINYLLKYV
jgi:hypothetical protein